MCGIVAAVAKRNIVAILLEGLKRLEYRGYDSAGMAVINPEQVHLQLHRVLGKVGGLEEVASNLQGHVGIAHTRWATHGKPSEQNAHPHVCEEIAIVHNGIIENYQQLREELKSKGYHFNSQTDSETIAFLIHECKKHHVTLLASVQAAIKKLKGAYAIAVISGHEPHTVVVARKDSPLVIGVGIEENYIASDPLALRQVTDRFVYLDDGETAEITVDGFTIYDKQGALVEREIERATEAMESTDKGSFRHFMLKEIFEQPKALKNTLLGRISQDKVLEQSFGAEAGQIFDQVENVQIVACGTSYHAGIVAKYWLEDWAGIPCSVEVASEFRYRKTVVRPNTLFVTISQSGQTADTLAALAEAKKSGYLSTLAICNVANSALVRESELVFLTQAGIEIGVASTKAFTTQLVALQILVIALGRRTQLSPEREAELVNALTDLPVFAAAVLQINNYIQQISNHFTEKHHSLFLGRGVQYPIALEGALKIKEISYIHAEAYPSGELKHGPLALVDSDMPVIAVAPSGELLEKIKSNLEEVAARGGKLYVFADEHAGFRNDEQTTVIKVPTCPESIAPIIYTLPLQLLSYHVAVNKGTDVDQPRNLAKSVTVE
ncbi:glutamine--fructose-6-phosphate transaminase (isomerizing) [Halioxenophilus sp. WMMB6]|uniref:glutamine--fructose-6-phosphate transaminase (isomerizing) n=1 Tax=Halioxenophilus sp. WMMB6 TaxID=3073815 RepID=UPI00295E8622|nr:glutamine--fructose-6-phosphate transaminase (isomerizing) [Halioxenophilus sp. WMMB6]